MAEIGIIASVVTVAEVGLQLSIRLYAFGETVARADKTILMISKDVAMTSSVLKDLGQTLEKDKESHIVSQNAVQIVYGVVEDCKATFQEMDSIFIEKTPHLKYNREERVTNKS